MSDEKIILTLAEQFEQIQKEQSNLSALYPPLPDDYFEKHPIEFAKEKNIIDKYRDLPIQPFIRKIDLNDKEGTDEENKLHNAWQIGLNFEF